VKKTGRFVFHTRTKDLEWARTIDAARGSADGRRKLVTMVKKHTSRCIVCRFEFNKSKCGRQAPLDRLIFQFQFKSQIQSPGETPNTVQFQFPENLEVNRVFGSSQYTQP